MQKRVIVLTGGTSGIAVNTIEELLEKDYFVEFTYNRNIALADSIQETYGSDCVCGYKVDLNNIEQCTEFANHITKKCEYIHGFIHNAGITKIGHLTLSSAEDWFNVFNINVLNIYPLIKEISAKMILQKEGSIIFISSIAGVKPAEGQANYAASKSALIALAQSLGKELGRFNIRVNTISPGFIGTEMVKVLSKKYLDDLRKQIPLGRFGEPQEIAKVIKFLLSEDASYINCSNIVVDGGLI